MMERDEAEALRQKINAWLPTIKGRTEVENLAINWADFKVVDIYSQVSVLDDDEPPNLIVLLEEGNDAAARPLRELYANEFGESDFWFQVEW